MAIGAPAVAPAAAPPAQAPAAPTSVAMPPAPDLQTRQTCQQPFLCGAPDPSTCPPGSTIGSADGCCYTDPPAPPPPQPAGTPTSTVGRQATNKVLAEFTYVQAPFGADGKPTCGTNTGGVVRDCGPQWPTLQMPPHYAPAGWVAGFNFNCNTAVAASRSARTAGCSRRPLPLAPAALREL